MKESPFVQIFKEASAKEFGEKLIVKQKTNLLYELTLNKSLQPTINHTESPKRGSSAFQTDICVFESINSVPFPRIVIEFKTRVTTHDIITYSAKAGKHKKIYPGLRYGLIASELDAIPHRFFIHNENLDFFVAATKYKSDTALLAFVRELIKTEIDISRELDKIYFDKKKYDYYRTDIIFKNFGNQ